MTNKVEQSTDELKIHYDEQLGFLERSADAFDAGFVDEAKRLAITIRILVHDTNNSHSLLSQLGLKGSAFCDSSIEPEPGSLIAHAGLVGISVNPPVVKHVARLDGDDPSWFRWVNFDRWWNTVIFRYGNNRELTRKDVVLAVSNQDGGAHVDPSLDEDYARLSRGNALGRFSSEEGNMIPLGEAELAAVRQVAHELLRTLKPEYRKKPPPEHGAIIGNVSVHFTPGDVEDPKTE